MNYILSVHRKSADFMRQVGLLAWREQEQLPTASPSPSSQPSGFLKRQPSLAVAGPRRFCTEVPFERFRTPEVLQYEPTKSVIVTADTQSPATAMEGNSLHYRLQVDLRSPSQVSVTILPIPHIWTD